VQLWYLALGAGEIFGDPNVDKVAVEHDAAKHAGRGERRQHIALQRAALAKAIHQRSAKEKPLVEMSSRVPQRPAGKGSIATSIVRSKRFVTGVAAT
jgi:hypothetical protein